MRAAARADDAISVRGSRRSASSAWREISAAHAASAATLRERLGESPPPLRYVLTATGNVYEDVVHGLRGRARPAATSSR